MAIVDPFAPQSPAPVGIVDPFAAPPAPAAAPAAVEPDTSATQRAGVVARTLAPYATAATAGALAGAPVGGVGAIPGALLGVGALGLGNLATGIYNLTAPRFGATPIDTPSEAIRNVFAAGGVGRKPTTSEQAVAASAMEGALDAASLSGAGRVIGGKVGNWFAARPGVQTVAGASGAATPTILREYAGVEDPRILFLSSLIGGIAGGKSGARLADWTERGVDAARRSLTNANISSEALKQRAQAGFNATDASGVTYDAGAMARFASDVRQSLAKEKYYPSSPRYVEVTNALKQVDEFAAGPQTIGDLHSLRQDLRKYAQTAGPDGGRMISKIMDDLDDFVATPQNASLAAAGDVTAASGALKSAISDWSKLVKSDQIETLIERAARVENTPFASALRTQFRTLANNPARMRRFNEAEREAINAIAEGATSSVTLKALAKLTPNVSFRNLLLAAGAGAVSPAATPYALGVAGAAGAGALARGARNYFAGQEANALAAAMRRGDVRAPVITPAMEMFYRGLPQATMQAQQPADYYLPQ